MHDLTRPEGSEPQDFHLSRRSLASMFFAGYAIAAVSAEAAPIVTDTGGLTIDEVTIPNGAPAPLPAYVARPTAKGRHPVVIVVSEIFGIHDYIKDVCRRLAKAGYVAVAPDFFYRSGANLPALTDMAAIRKVVGEASDAQVDGDVRATTDWIARQPFARAAAIGITGFCWGGSVVWRSAMVNPAVKAGVAWYGRLAALVPRAAELRAPVLGLYGGQDKGIPPADVDAMRAALRAAGRPGEIVVYPDAPHGFHADYRAGYDAAAAADGWRRMLDHFRRHGVA